MNGFPSDHLQWLVAGSHLYFSSIDVVLESLSCTHHSETFFLNRKPVHFRWSQCFCVIGYRLSFLHQTSTDSCLGCIVLYLDFGSNRCRPCVVERISLTLLKASSCSVFHLNGTSVFSTLLISDVTLDISSIYLRQVV